jgi:hypothetical protein
MSIPPAWPQCLDCYGTSLVIEPSQGQLSRDAGLLPIRQFDERIGLTLAFAQALDDPRDPDLTEHTFLKMVRPRAYGIAHPKIGGVGALRPGLQRPQTGWPANSAALNPCRRRCSGSGEVNMP